MSTVKALNDQVVSTLPMAASPAMIPPTRSTARRGEERRSSTRASADGRSPRRAIAKTTRDAMMTELDAQFPGYGFKQHKGYPTPEHCRLLAEKGAVPIHRRSFARVRQALGLEPVQLELEAAPVILTS